MFKNIERKQRVIDDVQRFLMEQQQRSKKSGDMQESHSNENRLFSTRFCQSVQKIEQSLLKRRKKEFDALDVASVLSRYL